MDEREIIYEKVGNYTKYKLIEMLITRMNDGKLNLDNLNSIEDVADEVDEQTDELQGEESPKK